MSSNDVSVDVQPADPEAWPQRAELNPPAPRRPSRAHTGAIRLGIVCALLALGAASVGVASWSVVHGGIGWDTAPDTASLLVVRSIHSSSTTLAQAYTQAPNNYEFYGPFLQESADFVHRVLTGATTPLAADNPTTYVYQGAVNLFFSVLAISVLAVALGVVFQSLLAGAFAWSLTLATPLWIGMSHVDFKDVPAAAGITLETAALLLAFALPQPRRAAIVGAVLGATGGAIALATRPGTFLLLVGIALSGGAAAAVRAFTERRPAGLLPTAVTGASTLIGALAVTWATDPIARIDMPRWLLDTAKADHPIAWVGTIRTAGQDVLSTHLPWWYVPAWLGAQLPLLTLAAVAGGIVVLCAQAFRRRWTELLPLVPLGVQGVLIPVAIVATGAVLYDGIRHVLFVVPALVAISAIAVAVLDRGSRASRRRLNVALSLFALAAVAASFTAVVRWAPYEYAYINPIAGRNPKHRSWELDYWGVSAREGIRRLRAAGLTNIYVEPSPTVGIPYGAKQGRPTPGPRTGLYVFLRWSADPAAYGCKTIFTISRGGHVLGEGARCSTTSRSTTRS